MTPITNVLFISSLSGLFILKWLEILVRDQQSDKRQKRREAGAFITISEHDRMFISVIETNYFKCFYGSHKAIKLKRNKHLEC